MDDTDVVGDEQGPWQIKAIRASKRERALRYARMAGQTVGEWITDAIDSQAAIQDGNRVIPPSRPEQTQPNAGWPREGVDLDDPSTPIVARPSQTEPDRPTLVVQLRELVEMAQMMTPAGRDSRPMRLARQCIGDMLQQVRDAGRQDAGRLQLGLTPEPPRVTSDAPTEQPGDAGRPQQGDMLPGERDA